MDVKGCVARLLIGGTEPDSIRRVLGHQERLRADPQVQARKRAVELEIVREGRRWWLPTIVLLNVLGAGAAFLFQKLVPPIVTMAPVLLASAWAYRKFCMVRA